MDNALTAPASNASNALPALAVNTPKRQRQAAALQRLTPRTPQPVTREVDALLAFLPDNAVATTPRPSSNVDCREWLRPSMQVTPDPVSHAPSVSFGEPPLGLTGVECVLWRDIGHTCARASLFLHQWLTTRRYMPACEASGVQAYEVTMFREASPTFHALYEAVQTIVNTGKVHRTVDTLHALANGDIRKIKTVATPDGEVTTTDEGAIYDTKAAQLELAALDPARFGAGKASGSGVSVSITVNAPYTVPAVHVERVIDASADVTDAEYVEA